MHVRAENPSPDDLLRLVVDAGVELANTDANDQDALRTVLIEHDILRATKASVAELGDMVSQFAAAARIIRSLPDLELDDAITAVNAELKAITVSPMLSRHDESPVHLHWTPSTASFADQLVTDVLMALAQTLCSSSTDRFGQCAAVGCDNVFFDISKNRSRRFCSDQRCASRTHTAEHRARRKATSTSDRMP